ncbi:hypothetical protein FJZ20_02510, partial [Candidatus Pacearchaeota archaeon]|nr:hypothetical protein [Candidatus Pacearchaeota archaeon]
MKDKENSKELINIPVRWIVSFVFLIIGILIGSFLWNTGSLGFLGLTGSVISESSAEQKLIDFFENEVPGSSVEIVSVTKQGSFYEFELNLDGDVFSVYVTTDG